MDSEYAELFETITKESNISPTTVAAFLTETLTALKREGTQIDKVSDSQIRQIFKHVSSGELTKEAIPNIVDWLAKNEDKNLQDVINSLGLKVLSREDIEKIVDNIIANNKRLVEERGMQAFGPLMGMVMKELRGKADAAIVGEFVRKKLEDLRKSEPSV